MSGEDLGSRLSGGSSNLFSHLSGVYAPTDNSGSEDDEDPLLGFQASNPRGMSAWDQAWNAVFKITFAPWCMFGEDGTRKNEKIKINHQFSAEERVKMANVESIDYLAPNSAMYRKWLYRQPHRRVWDRWVMMGLIGTTTGLVGQLLYAIISMIADFKYGSTRWLIAHSNMAVAWIWNTLVSTSLIAASSALAVGLAPQAIGSGIPEVMAYLNGCMIPKVFNIFTLVVKFMSCALAVASGLPVGPEGPLIHIGAALGSALSQGHSTTLRFSTNMFRRFRNPKDKRDFVTAGASVGVATAFNAPIGGLLFAFEEVASFWQQSLGWQVFFACMCAVLALNMSKSAGRALLGEGSFGWFNNDVAFEQVGMSFSAHILAVVPATVIGVAAGLAAAVFTYLNIMISRLRAELTSHLKWHRMIEPCVLAVIYTTGVMLLPLFFPCTPTECYQVENGELQCETGLRHPTGEYNASLAVVPDNAPSLPLYTCRVVEHMVNGTWIPRGDSIMPDFDPVETNSTETVFYNQLATLLFSTGEEGIKHLFARGTHRRFDYATIIVFGIYYFLGAVVCAGSAISSGLFVPMLMIGACIGRCIGLLTVDVAQSLGTSWSVETFGEWSWIDPGAFALVGAGAFMGGVTRLTVALAVIMVEISSDVHMLLPVLVAIMTAKWVADSLIHALYHGLLEAKCVPFLPSEPTSQFSLDLVPVSYLMRSPVVTLKQKMKVREITEAVRGVSHNGFPVVKNSSSGQVFVGLLTRSHILALLQRVVAEGRTEGLEVPWRELNRRVMDPVDALRAIQGQQMAVLTRELDGALPLSAQSPQPPASKLNGSCAMPPREFGEYITVEVEAEAVMCDETPNAAAVAAAARSGGGAGGSGRGVGSMSEELEDMVLDLGPYMNTSTFVIPESFSVERAYLLFRTMGLRHLVVLDTHHRVKGMITRKDLMGYRLDDALAKALDDSAEAARSSAERSLAAARTFG